MCTGGSHEAYGGRNLSRVAEWRRQIFRTDGHTGQGRSAHALVSQGLLGTCCLSQPSVSRGSVQS